MPNSVYPGAVLTYTVKTNKVDLVDAAHVNQLQYDAIALSTTLGINPQGSVADVATRLAVMIAQSGGLVSGTSFPGTPVNYQLFYRTDLGQVYIWSGSAWAAVSAISNIQIFTGSGTFTAPTGITKVYVSMCGGGASGGNGTQGNTGGGGAGESLLNFPYTVVPGNNYTVTIGAAGVGTGSSTADGQDGGDTSFDAALVCKGGKGGKGSAGTGAGGLGGRRVDAATYFLDGSASTVTDGVASQNPVGSIRGGNGAAKGGNPHGGASMLGNGAVGSGSAASPTLGFGGGGSGTSNVVGGGTYAGGSGKAGVCIVAY